LGLPAKIERAAPAAAKARIPVARPRLPGADAVLPYIERIDAARWYSNFGPLVSELEQRLAARLGEGALVATAINATQALALTLKAMDLPAGGLVAVPSWTFVATAHAVLQAGLVPWFMDVDPETWMLTPETVEAAVRRAPGALVAAIPVCPFGAMPDLAAWRALREATGVKVLVDAAAAFDTLAEADPPVCVSLHATKVLGVGEGGFLATTDPQLYERFRRLICFGFKGTRESPFPSSNAKLSEYAAAVGLAAMDEWPSERLRYLRTSQHMRIALMGRPKARFQAGWGSDWVTSVCVIGLPAGSADQVEADLGTMGVETRRWWGDGCHRSPAFLQCPRDDLPVTERLAASTIGLPFAVDLPGEDIERIADALGAAID
jgi:dTDP-4-amino-4,6-dideoxygalactose transaminase